MKNPLIDISCVIKHETERAVLIDHGGKETCWLPKSMIEMEPNADGKTHTITLKQSFAEEKGIV